MTDEGDRAPGPEETLKLIEAQRAATVRRLKGDPLLLYGPWGVAWLLGFGMLFLHYGLDGEPYVRITQMQSVSVLLSLQVLAGAVAAYGITRMSVQTRGESSARGAMYGYAWFAGMTLMVIIAMRMSSLLPPHENGLLWAGVSMLVVGVLYMAGGAIWLDWTMFFVGVWVMAVNGVGVLLGAGWHALLSAVLLGGGFLAGSLWMRRRG
ncbi:transporter [Nonomuraea lactucae]|uniref:transporter n=1 Tax=Nonomuraea lactucae TaxID=2249762 RepID=UPI000DE21B2A|nr:transporter [Nonomuraea lactucae]